MISPEEQQAVAQDFAHRFNESWNAADGPAYGSVYWPDAELVDPTGTIWNGREAIERMHVELWRGPASGTQVQAHVRRVRPLADTLLVVDLDVSVSGFNPPPPGAAIGPDRTVQARLKHVVEKRRDAWGIVASQNTFVAAPPPR